MDIYNAVFNHHDIWNNFKMTHSDMKLTDIITRN